MFFQVVFHLCTHWFGGSTCLLSQSWARFLATIRSMSFPVVFCIVMMRYPFSLLGSFPSVGIGLKLLSDPSPGTCPVGKLPSCSLKSLLLLSTDRFLMSEYLILSVPGAVSLLSPESSSVTSSSVIRSSFEPASVRVLSSPFQTAFLSSRLFWLLCWMKQWSSVEPFSLPVFNTASQASMRSGCWCFQHRPPSSGRIGRSERVFLGFLVPPGWLDDVFMSWICCVN